MTVKSQQNTKLRYIDSSSPAPERSCAICVDTTTQRGGAYHADTVSLYHRETL